METLTYAEYERMYPDMGAAAVVRYDKEPSDGRPETRTGEFVVVRSKWHGGGIVSRHRSLRAALRVAKGRRCCVGGGCVGVIDAADYDRLPTVDRAWRAWDLARVEI